MKKKTASKDKQSPKLVMMTQKQFDDINKKIDALESDLADKKNYGLYWNKEAAMFENKYESLRAAQALTLKDNFLMNKKCVSLEMQLNALEVQNGLLEKIIEGSKKIFDNVIEFSNLNAENSLHRQDIYKSRELLRDGLKDVESVK